MSRQHQVHLTPDRVARLVAEYEAGTAMNVLAERYGIHRHSVRAHLDRAGVAIRPKGLSDVQIDEAVRLYVAGSSLAKISEQFGCDAETVRRALRLRRIVLRTPWQRL